MKISNEIRHFIHQQIFASLKAHQKLLYDLPLLKKAKYSALQRSEDSPKKCQKIIFFNENDG